METMMKMLPIFYFPTTIVYLSDEQSATDPGPVKIQFDHIKYYKNPDECLGYLSAHTNAQPQPSYLQPCKDHDSYDTINQTPVSCNVPSIFKTLQHKNDKHDEISVIIVDLNHSGISTVDFCRKLHNTTIKKIALITASEYENAITALNDQVVDLVVIKDTRTTGDLIQTYIKILQQKYFIEKTRSLLSHLEVRKELPLSDPLFIDFFSKWCAQNNIREYYLIDKFGSMAVVNNVNQISYFVLHTDYSLDLFEKLNEESGEALGLIERVRQRKNIPFFGVGKESWEFTPDQWNNYFHEPRVLVGRKKYYYTIV
jgi:CheY-like chemotaxis protein